MQATFSKCEKTFSQAKYDRFIAKEVRSMTRLRDKGHRDFRSMTDEGIRNAAERLASIYDAGSTFIKVS